MDETGVDCTIGRLKRAFVAAGKRNGGYRGIKSTYGVSRHITAVISSSAEGHLTPTYFIAVRKRENSDWAPVKGEIQSPPFGIIARFTQENWFPRNGVIDVSTNGSM